MRGVGMNGLGTTRMVADDVALVLQALQPVTVASLLAEPFKTHLAAGEHGSRRQRRAEQNDQSLRPQQGDIP